MRQINQQAHTNWPLITSWDKLIVLIVSQGAGWAYLYLVSIPRRVCRRVPDMALAVIGNCLSPDHAASAANPDPDNDPFA